VEVPDLMINTLIVDDDARFRRFVKGIFSSDSDIEVIGEAEDGQEAILKARETNPDLVIMDIRMPVMNGLEATSQLKKEMDEIKVIILTLYDFEEYREAAKAVGVVDYIIKKSINEELIPAIRKAFEPKNV